VDLSLLDDISLEEKGYTGGFNSDTSLLFILSGIGGSGITSSLSGNNTGFGNEGIGKGTLAVIDVSNNRHVSNVVCLVLTFSNLVNCEVWHIWFGFFLKVLE